MNNLLIAFPLADYAELLGAIYGDGHIQKRGKQSWKVAVAVSDQYPAWLARMRELMVSVFGRYSERERPSHTGVMNYELYLTTHDLYSTFRIHEKYNANHELVPPSWIDADPMLRRRFIRGLVETDGMFKPTGDARSPGKEWARFSFAQKCETLIDWVAKVLLEEGFPVIKSFHQAATVWYVRLHRQADVQRLGEWLESYKWIAFLDSGATPAVAVVDRKAGGRRVTARPAVVHKTIAVAEQDEWRELRRLGASIGAIARNFGRSNSVVGSAVCDIVPDRHATALFLGLKPRPRIPRRVPRSEVDEWRARVAAGESADAIALFYKRRAGQVAEATRDVAWDLEEQKRKQ